MANDGRPYADADELVNHWWWRPGWQPGTHWYSWHITLERQSELHQLVADYQKPLARFPQLDLIPTQWLHITVQGIGNARKVKDADRDAIAAAVHERLAELPPIEGTFHQPVLHREAIVIPPEDPEPFRVVRAAIRQGIADVWGADNVPELAHGFRPHFSIAYVNDDVSAPNVRQLLDDVSSPAVTTKLERPTLIDLNRDNRMYEWQAVRRPVH